MQSLVRCDATWFQDILAKKQLSLMLSSLTRALLMLLMDMQASQSFVGCKIQSHLFFNLSEIDFELSQFLSRGSVI